MTKQDYQAIARALNAVKPSEPVASDHAERVRALNAMGRQWKYAVDAITITLGQGNPRFDAATFRAACEMGV